MNATEQLISVVEASGAEPATKALALEYLRAAGPVIEALGISVFQQIMAAAAAGTLPDALVERLNAAQVAALLALAETEMAALADQHRAELAARKIAWAQLQSAALGALARALVGVL